MAQSSSPASASSLYVPQSQLHPSVHSCHWSWCRATFHTNSALNEHVIEDHVRLSVPVRRQDIPLLRRSDEGVGESLSLSLQSYYRPTPEESSLARTDHDPPDPEPSSSLPSPPASLSLILNAQDDLDEAPPSWPSKPATLIPHDSPMLSQDPHTVEQGASSGSVFPHLHPDMPTTPTTIRPRHVRTPSFAALSSPIQSPYHETSFTTFPALEDMVDRAISDGRQQTMNPFRPHESQSFIQPIISRSSVSSFASQNSVEAQLTQNIENNNEEHTNFRTPDQSQPSTKTPPFGSPVLTREQSYSVVDAATPPHQTQAGLTRQSWYGTMPRQGKTYSRKSHGSEHSYGDPTTPKPPHGKNARDAGKEWGHKFRSGTVPTPITTYIQGGEPELSQASTWLSPGRSQGDDFLQSQSYPMQTQAPYWSQSDSQ